MPALDRRTLLQAGLLAAVAGLAGIGALSPALAEDAYADPDDLYAALRRQPVVPVMIGDRQIDVVFIDGAPGVDRPRVLAWVRRSGVALAGYFGRFPVAGYGLLVIAQDGDGVGHATTFGYQGSLTRIRVGRSSGDAAFARDWVLVHEMFHTALPDMPRRALWLQEGNATWLEPVARAAAGQLQVTEVWRQAINGMPSGEPRPGDGGMNGTTAHDRLYWGGATFWLRAEIAILQASGGRRTLRDAMRAINRASGGNKTDWSPEQTMAAGDRATGTDALSSLYARFAGGPEHSDLPALFSRLGVIATTDGIVLDDAAPLAAIRQRITGR